MLFSSTLFLFLFLPFVLAVNFFLPPKIRNFFLLAVSLVFYAWGEGILVLVMIVSMVFNYFAGLAIAAAGQRPAAKIFLGIAVALNVAMLVYYKYLHFLSGMIPFLKPLLLHHTSSIVLPLGISFYTFHSISYLTDVHRKGLPGERNPINLGLYISFFPQLVAGPIVRYNDLAAQLHQRSLSIPQFYEGVIRFIRGLAKKVIIANTMGLIADRVFELNAQDIPGSMAWLGILCYSIQIYYDFSGYSDMAIGLASMFGFTFKENFNHPYTAVSLQDFWRRWHISLSTWFRDYLYIPLGGNRGSLTRTYVNLLIVFLITGLWHGASWNFVVWGLFHGMFLMLERSGLINTERFPKVVRHFYTCLVVLLGWVFFRSNSLEYAFAFLKSLAGFSSGSRYTPVILLDGYVAVVFLLAMVFVAPVRAKWRQFVDHGRNYGAWYAGMQGAFYLILFLWCTGELTGSSYNPFIYFRF